MSNISYTYAYFDVLNFTNEFAISGYALDICPFVFKPSYDTALYSNKRILWDFGDGTNSKSITATHAYTLPGKYTVSLYVYDGAGNAYYDSFSQIITVHNFIDDSIVLSAADFNFTTSSVSDNKFEIYRFNSWQTYNSLSGVGYSVALAASGNNSPFISQKEYNSDKYAHLKKYSQFYQYEFNSDIEEYEYVAKDAVTTSNTEIYVKLYNNALQVCDSTEVGATFVGTSGYAVASYKDDTSTTTNPTLIFAHFTDINFKDYDSTKISLEANHKPILQTTAQSFYCTLTSHAPAGLQITSNGLSSMSINAVQFVNTKIPFIIQIVDDEQTACKYCNNLKRVSNFGALSANTIQLSALDATTYEPLSVAVIDNFEFFSNYDTGIYKGYCSFQSPLTGVRLFARAEINSEFGTQTFTVTGQPFEVIDASFNIGKVNEDFGAVETLKSYRFQETLLDKHIFFDDFLGTIVGNVSSSTDGLGKRIYERISNFVANTQDVDVCNIPALYSLKQMVDINVKQFERYNFSVPADLARLMDLLSIKHSKLWGSENEWAENFDNKGFPYSDTWGVNLGSELSPLTTLLTAGASTKPIVSYEKFSNTYKLINTDALSSTHLQFVDPVKQTYPLSAYNNFWGWGLVLPHDFTPDLFDHYYLFYEYIPGPAANIVDAIINWNDSNTTVTRNISSFGTWSNDNGTMQTMLANALLDGLNLFESVSGEEAPLVQ